MHKAIFGLFSILFFAIVMTAADENTLAKDQRKLEALFSVSPIPANRKRNFSSVSWSSIGTLMRRVEYPDLAGYPTQLLRSRSLKASK
jgi:hypothetical protein